MNHRALVEIELLDRRLNNRNDKWKGCWQCAISVSIGFIIVRSGCGGPHETTRLEGGGDYRLRGVNQTTKISQSYSSKRSNQSICNCPP